MLVCCCCYCCRPRLRVLEDQNRALGAEVADFDSQVAQQLEQLGAEHELLRQRCRRWEGQVRTLCARHGEPLPGGLA